MGGGGGDEVEQESTLSPWQKVAERKLGRYLHSRIGSRLPEYQGERYVPMAPEEEAYLKEFGELYEDTRGVTGMAYKTLTGAMEEPLYQGESPYIQEYLDAREEEARRQFEEEQVPEVEEAYRGPGTYWGGVRSKAVSKAREAFEGEQRARRAQEELGLRQQVMQNRLATAQAGMGLAPGALARAVAGEQQIRAAEQKGLDVEYQDWLRRLPENNPAIKQALSFMGIPSVENIVYPGKEGSGGAIGGAVGGLLGAGLAPLTGGTSMALMPGTMGAGSGIGQAIGQATSAGTGMAGAAAGGGSGLASLVSGYM